MKLYNIKKITIYCSSSNRINRNYLILANKIGHYLASKNIGLIYGGGSNGIMGEIAKGFKFNNGYVVGIIPRFLTTKENLYENLNEKIIVKDMAQRKNLLYQKGDAFMALPGGPGTLEEITEVISWRNLEIHSKPIILFNQNKYWDSLIKLYEKFYNNSFSNKQNKKLFYVIKNLSELKELFKNEKN
tara:strand:- start:8091 stop:8651 length:561 start_codon:yes stop_codon:yes gene_type:complete